MYHRLLDLLRCPECQGSLAVEPLAGASGGSGEEIGEGLLHCQAEHWFPIVGGIPRMLPDALAEHWPALEPLAAGSTTSVVSSLRSRLARSPSVGSTYDRRTRKNFSLEWEHHETGGTTWGMDLDDRVRWFFLEPIRLDVDRLDGLVMLDAGCGPGSQSVAYTRYGLEVVALDLSSGLEHGQRMRTHISGARPDRVHFVQGDLQKPPFARATFDLVHSAGVLHHTPDTECTFRELTPLLRPGGTFYVWLYKYEPVVTPVVNTLRAVTTRVPPALFGKVADVSAAAFRAFCAAVDRLGLRSYPKLSQREAALALLDIFGAPYAHCHSYEEVAGWYRSEGFEEVWGCNEDRRGFGVCGRRRDDADSTPPESPDKLARVDAG